MKEQYHHGNLKSELIEAGIRIISEEGFEKLSLRNISKQCGVSHNAVYRHFSSKEQMIDCCREHVTAGLTDDLQKAAEGLDWSAPDTVHALGYAYIDFYREHPFYFSFLYRSSSVKIIFSMEKIAGNYPPFEVFREICCVMAEHNGMTKEEALKRLVKYWSLMHGVISLLVSPNVELDGEWKDYLKDIFL